MKILISIIFLLIPILSQAGTKDMIAGMVRHSQSITWGTTPSTMTVGDADQTLTGDATATSGLGITYTGTNNAAICTIVSGKLHAVGAGTCVVHADQAGNVHWFVATQANSGNVTISAGGPVLKQTLGTTQNDYGQFADTARVNLVMRFQASSSYTVDNIQCKLTKTGTLAGTVVGRIWNDTGSEPWVGTQNGGDSTTTLSANTITSDPTYTTYTFTWSSSNPTLTNAAYYNIGFYDNTAEANYIRLALDSTGSIKITGTSAPVWTSQGGAPYPVCAIYGH